MIRATTRITDATTFDELEIEESFVRATGPGGQNLNNFFMVVQPYRALSTGCPTAGTKTTHQADGGRKALSAGGQEATPACELKSPTPGGTPPIERPTRPVVQEASLAIRPAGSGRRPGHDHLDAVRIDRNGIAVERRVPQTQHAGPRSRPGQGRRARAPCRPGRIQRRRGRRARPHPGLARPGGRRDQPLRRRSLAPRPPRRDRSGMMPPRPGARIQALPRVLASTTCGGWRRSPYSHTPMGFGRRLVSNKAVIPVPAPAAGPPFELPEVSTSPVPC